MTPREETALGKLPQLARLASCRLFHSRRLMGPFADEAGSYYLCEIGHRFPCDLFPAAQPAKKPRVWIEVDDE